MDSNTKGNVAAAALCIGVATAVFVTAASETGNFPLDKEVTEASSPSNSPEATPSKSGAPTAVTQPSLTSSPSAKPSPKVSTIRISPVAFSKSKRSTKSYTKALLKRKYKRNWVKQWNCLNPLWKHESGWRYKAKNPYSGAYGIPQALPGSKMKKAGKDWKTNPRTQVRWGLNHYIYKRYGTPCKAWSHFKKKNWY
jgi:hypothetical protein